MSSLQSKNAFTEAIERAKRKLSEEAAENVAKRLGVRLEGGRFSFSYFGFAVDVVHKSGAIEWAGGSVRPADAVLLLHYLTEGKDIEPNGRWISYRELPDSSAYLGAFLDRGPNRIAQRFGHDVEAFKRACVAMGGRRRPEMPGVSFSIAALPRLPLALLLHEGEEGLAPAGQVLFDWTASLFWCAEDLAVLGELAAAYLGRVGLKSKESNKG